MDDVVSIAHPEPACPSQPAFEMVERLITIAPDHYGLLVAATWLWTRFDQTRNTALVRELTAHGIAPVDTSNLKDVDRALRRACNEVPEVLRRWCIGEGQPIGDPAVPPQTDEVA